MGFRTNWTFSDQKDVGPMAHFFGLMFFGPMTLDRLMYMKLDIEVMTAVVSAYAPQVGSTMEEKDKFWTDLDQALENIYKEERVVIGADFNGHVGVGNRGDEDVM